MGLENVDSTRWNPRIYIAGVFLTALLTGPASMTATPAEAESALAKDLDFVVSVCAQLPDGKDVLQARLQAIGWGQQRDPRTAYYNLASFIFAEEYSYRSKSALDNSIFNAFFVSDALFGNSSPRRLTGSSLIKGDLTLLVIGPNHDRIGFPQCVITGPDAAFDVFKGIVSLEATDPVSRGSIGKLSGIQYVGTVGNSDIKLIHVDLDEFREMVDKFGIGDTQQSRVLLDKALAAFTPVNALIKPIIPKEAQP